MTRTIARAVARAFLCVMASAVPPCLMAAGAGKVPIDPAWAADPIWDDGKAEISLYSAERMIEGRTRAHDLTMIVVKEAFSDEGHVKADPPYGGRAITTVMKMNLASTIPADNYRYQFLTSIFVRRDDIRSLVKATVGSQEWCGNTFKEILFPDGRARIHAHSYFDGQGEIDQDLALGADGLLDEQLLIALRAAALPQGGSVKVRIADPITSNTAAPVLVRDADLSLAGIEDLETPLGRTRARRYLVERDGGGVATYWIEESAPRSLLKMIGGDGRTMLLTGRERRDYWTRR